MCPAVECNEGKIVLGGKRLQHTAGVAAESHRSNYFSFIALSPSLPFSFNGFVWARVVRCLKITAMMSASAQQCGQV